jgi:hypothetical protein
MAGWTDDELAAIGGTDELRLASRRKDGSLRDPVIMWVVRDGDDLYVRSVKGRAGTWFRGTRSRHEGRVQSGGVTREVSFVDGDERLNERIDAAYRDKYRRYAKNIVDSTLTPQARAATIRLVPR